MFGCLRSVCKDIIVYNLGVERIPDYLLDNFEQGVHTDTFVAYFSSSRAQSSPEIDSDSSDGSTVYCSPSPPDDSFALGPVVSPTAQEENLYFIESPESPPHPPQSQDSTSSSSDSPVHFDSADINLDNTAEAQTSLPAANVDLSSLLDALQASLCQRMDDAHNETLSRLHTAERGLQTTLGNQNEYFRNLVQSARQEGHLQDDLQILRLNELRKSVMAHDIKADTDSLYIRNKLNALDAKVLLLDGQIAAIQNDQIEFHTRIAADILSLSTQIGDIVDYIRGGDAIKGEIGSSSRRPPPVRVERRPLPTPANQGESSSGHGRVLNVEEAAEIVREEYRQADRREREREREKSLRRLRRRGH
ncbi:movement protein binding protein 2C [Dorcoceras hygrometricum]|uniref:Movement protein binding protein 2C n=1 Tax=Dorcoceras hygrometricum TaxID=472368 RepID=A0A2Z7AKS0_9LAMI|nr:movement protein binding protein 2C [Dorcoceras hygrometricum]